MPANQGRVAECLNHSLEVWLKPEDAAQIAKAMKAKPKQIVAKDCNRDIGTKTSVRDETKVEMPRTIFRATPPTPT